MQNNNYILKNFYVKKLKMRVLLFKIIIKTKYRKISHLLINLFCWELCCKANNFGSVRLVIIPKLTLSGVIIFIADMLWK